MAKLYAGFNTQPPEGGWQLYRVFCRMVRRFNTQPPEGGWAANTFRITQTEVSTHSRLKAAGGRGKQQSKLSLPAA